MSGESVGFRGQKQVDSIAKKIVLEERRLPEDLHVPLAAVDENAIESFIGEIVDVVSFRTPNRALVVRVPTPAPELRKLPIWQLKRSAFLHPSMQLWVHINYTAYRKAYCRAFPKEDIKNLVLHHTISRRSAKINGFQYVRITPISRQVNSSLALSEGWYAKLKRKETKPRLIRQNAHIKYADLDDLLVIMGIVLGGGTMQLINEAQYLVDANKSVWPEDLSPLKVRLRALGESVPIKSPKI